MKEKKITTKEKIIMKGAEIIHRKGFNNTGIQEILTEAGVPRGSFYFHFKSKDDFGLQLIEAYKIFTSNMLKEFFDNQSISPVERIRNYFKFIIKVQKDNNFKLGCPIGNLAQEMGDLNTDFGQKLNDVFEVIKVKFSDCLRQAKEQNEIQEDIDAETTADMILCCYEGVLLRMKVLDDNVCNEQLLENMMKTIFVNLLNISEV